MSDLDRGEVDRVRAVYDRYDNDPDVARRWDHANPGNRRILAERRHVFADALSGSQKIVELGSGTGAVIADLNDSTEGKSFVFGLDVVPERARMASQAGAVTVVSDATCCALQDRCVDVVVNCVAMSSIAPQLWPSVANEIHRILKPGGMVLWHDLRVPNPWNHHVKPLSRHTLATLFPNFTIVVRSATVLPQLSRRLPQIDRWYPALVRTRVFNTHLLGVLRAS